MASVAYALAPVGDDAAGGAEQILAALDRALVGAGHRSIVIACRGSRTAGEWVDTGVTVEAAASEAAREAAEVATQRALANVLAREHIDCVHMHGIDFARIMVGAMPPTLVTLHLPPDWYDPPLDRAPQNVRFVSVSEHQRARCPQAVAPALVPNGVDVRRLAAVRHARRNFALVLGRICEEKGQDVALDAAHRAGIPALLAGPVFPYPAHTAYFEEHVRPLLDAHRRYLGPVGFARKRRLLAAARCLLVPSLCEETSSLVAMEALACGTPVIAMRRGALPEIVTHGETGFIVDDAAGMAEAIDALSRIDPAACMDAASTRFDVGRMSRAYLDLYATQAALAA